MFKHLIGTTFAAAIAFTGFSAKPAQAGLDEGELLRLLLGLGAAAVILDEINDNDKKRKKVVRPRVNKPATVVNPRRTQPPVIHGTIVPKKPKKHTRKFVPVQCERRIQTPTGSRYVFGRPCLERLGFQAKLPSSCRVNVKLERRTVPAWTKRCLRRNGYSIR